MSVVQRRAAVEVDAATALAEAEEVARRRRQADEAGALQPGSGEGAPGEPGAPPAEEGRGGPAARPGAGAPEPGDPGAASAAIRELLAVRGVGDKAIADLVLQQLGGAGVDLDRLLEEIRQARDRDRVSVAAEALAGQLRGVIEQVQRTAGASGAAVDVRLKEMESLAYLVIQTALSAQSVLELAERSGGRISTRLHDIVRAAEDFLTSVGAAHAEVLAAEKAAGRWVAYSSTVGRGLWWWALVGGFAGGVIGTFVSLVFAWRG